MARGRDIHKARIDAIGFLHKVGYPAVTIAVSNEALAFMVSEKDPAFAGGNTHLRAVDFLLAYRLELQRRAMTIDVPGCVYIIGNRDRGLCKIGFSMSPMKRMETLQTGCPFELSMLARFENRGRSFERLLHERAQPYHERGEWFRIEGRLKDFLDNGASKNTMDCR